jgi:hypothetical protein
VTGRRGRRRRELLDDLEEIREYSHLKEEALDSTMWRADFERGYIYIYIYITLKEAIYIYIYTWC